MHPSKASCHKKLQEDKVKDAVEVDGPADDKEAFQTFIAKHHQAFCLDDDKRGETGGFHGH